MTPGDEGFFVIPSQVTHRTVPRDVSQVTELASGALRCTVCPRQCVIPPGERGHCGVREHRNGSLVLLTYGKSVSAAVDPIEKKPLFHFAPGSSVLSIATRGCNFACDFCQNHQIALEHTNRQGRSLPPETLARRLQDGAPAGIAYTYTEPTVFMEYAYDTMQAVPPDAYNVFVSNGYMTPETARKLGSQLDAINVDIKGDTQFYRDHCGIPDPSPIYDALDVLADQDVWIEVTNLLVPGENTDMEMIAERMDWIVETLGPDTPVHFSRFHPDYELTDLPPTPIDTLEEAMTVAENAGLRYVYCGNVPGHEAESTYCPNCDTLVIERNGFTIQSYNLVEGACPSCGHEIPIAGSTWTAGETTRSRRRRRR